MGRGPGGMCRDNGEYIYSLQYNRDRKTQWNLINLSFRNNHTSSHSADTSSHSNLFISDFRINSRVGFVGGPTPGRGFLFFNLFRLKEKSRARERAMRRSVCQGIPGRCYRVPRPWDFSPCFFFLRSGA